MTIARKLKEYLDKNKAKYKVSTHQEVYTAQEVAASLHVPGKDIVKVVIIKTTNKYVMAVLSADHKVNVDKVRTVLRDPGARLATEGEFKSLFPDCDVGAMPPFGNLYNIGVYVDKALTEDEEIVFQAGSHVETIRMKYSDFDGLVGPEVVDFGKHL
ncbi:MAG: deacylase [Planctomycetes bacterium RIFCSPHIGHO2_02_FULL_50_42]|nr:MAG: deacylase [Planctomycetes bacterium GWA2_50_13]OHB89933.1 MAG: deacylase [Planctomycetes bacterium RIFCSPHIGHO2_02_FULL_50_42]OHB92787.1 MAG: deacylase [Planctomycetes bacterium RIFCSPHIGHO2_12_FULL_51_37]OHB96138.1 MAG: deacylase [Planctomycetes bacterium RIFCSPLOWO2_02_FULL_50_16]OHC02818.1 MAG: deacylase [Planctomycetes bacterium RIFCSPLOWO2_12_FULL_50_35]